MNNKVFIANINWLKPTEGGRKLPVPFKKDKYCPVALIDGEDCLSNSAYGLICYSFKFLKEFCTLAYVRYLNTDSAPDNLVVGTKLKLFEGNKLVAVGEIVQETDYRFNF